MQARRGVPETGENAREVAALEPKWPERGVGCAGGPGDHQHCCALRVQGDSLNGYTLTQPPLPRSDSCETSIDKYAAGAGAVRGAAMGGRALLM